MLVFARTEPVALVHRLDLDLPQIRQNIATMMAIRNIMPRMQKASANLDEDMQSTPSEWRWFRSLAGYSSAARTKSVINAREFPQNEIKIYLSNSPNFNRKLIAQVYLPEPFVRRSLRARSNSICGAMTANELNTSMRPSCCSTSTTNGSDSLQST